MDYKGGSAAVLVLLSIGERQFKDSRIQWKFQIKGRCSSAKVRDVNWEEKLEEDANGDQIRLLSDTHFVQCRHHL